MFQADTDPDRRVESAFERLGNYFSIGYPVSVYCEIDGYVQDRLIQHLQRRSQRPYRRPEGESWFGHLRRLGLLRLSELVQA